MTFLSQKVARFFFPSGCVTFLSREVPWFFCPERLHDFFVSRGCVIFFLSQQVARFFCLKRLRFFLSQEVAWFIFVPRSNVIWSISLLRPSNLSHCSPPIFLQFSCHYRVFQKQARINYTLLVKVIVGSMLPNTGLKLGWHTCNIYTGHWYGAKAILHHQCHSPKSLKFPKQDQCPVLPGCFVLTAVPLPATQS